ncbi:Protein of unknown function [Gryllus bimaculatus]|nr:Protein of unknown function [Gryllus bimaculatus]
MPSVAEQLAVRAATPADATNLVPPTLLPQTVDRNAIGSGRSPNPRVCRLVRTSAVSRHLFKRSLIGRPLKAPLAVARRLLCTLAPTTRCQYVFVRPSLHVRSRPGCAASRRHGCARAGNAGQRLRDALGWCVRSPDSLRRLVRLQGTDGDRVSSAALRASG